MCFSIAEKNIVLSIGRVFAENSAENSIGWGCLSIAEDNIVLSIEFETNII